MKLQDLDYLESASVVNHSILGAASAYAVYAGGDVYAGYGAGSANALAVALGPSTNAVTNTKVVTSLYPDYGITQSTAKAKATATAPGFSGSASYFGNSSFAGTGSGGITATLTTTSTRRY
jgi:hypothetical protein